MALWSGRKFGCLTPALSIFITLVFFLSTSSIAAQLTFAWDPNDPPVDGYLLFMRVDDYSYDYLCPAWSGTDTTCTLDQLSNGTYYFVVHAYSGTAESVDSNEVKVIITDSILSGSGDDCDVDGMDLADLVKGDSDLEIDVLASTFGSVTCP